MTLPNPTKNTGNQTMPEGKSEIPAYLRTVAHNLIIDHLRLEDDSEQAFDAAKQAIAKALLAEREACAKIAEGDAAGFDFQQALADGDDLNVGANSARLGIAQEILPGYRLGIRPSSTEENL